MSGIAYLRYTGELDLEDLLQEILDRLRESSLYSGFGFSPLRGEGLDEETLRELLKEILLREGRIGQPNIQAWMENLPGTPEEKFERLLQQLIHQLEDAAYITPVPEHPSALTVNGYPGSEEFREPEHVRYELTDKSLDFFGFKALQELFGDRGRAGYGAHDTNQDASAVEAYLDSKPYEFGDLWNLDLQQTLLSAWRREGLKFPVPLTYDDLYVRQGEQTTRCATVILLDCSHSMILYGEDRFTPAKKVALAIAHLIRTRYPGDTLDCVLFHDRAEVISLRKLAQARVGPFYTNTREGLQRARRVLMNRRCDLRQILMITDGKPSALTLPDGRIYKNPYGLDPIILQETLQEAVRCRKSGILVHTFMLTQDPYLVAFVRRFTRLAQGKAYFTTPLHLGRAVLEDFLHRKKYKVH